MAWKTKTITHKYTCTLLFTVALIIMDSLEKQTKNAQQQIYKEVELYKYSGIICSYKMKYALY